MRRHRAGRSVYRSVGWVAWHTLVTLFLTSFAAGSASEVSEPLAAVAGAAGLALAARASTMSVVITDDTVRVRNVFRTHAIPTEDVQEADVEPTFPWFSLSYDQLAFSAQGRTVRASSCCQSWWWKGPSLRLRDAVRADIEQRTGRPLAPLVDWG